MQDDKYAIQLTPKESETQLAVHQTDRRRTNIALAVAGLAAIFACWQAWEAHEARLDAKKAIDGQARDIERSIRAAEAGASAARKLADSNSSIAQVQARTLSLAEQNAQNETKRFHDELRPSLYVTKAHIDRSIALTLTAEFANKGKIPAQNIMASCNSAPYNDSFDDAHKRVAPVTLIREGPMNYLPLAPDHDTGVLVLLREDMHYPDVEHPSFYQFREHFDPLHPPDTPARGMVSAWQVTCSITYSDSLDPPSKHPAHGLGFCYDASLSKAFVIGSKNPRDENPSWWNDPTECSSGVYYH